MTELEAILYLLEKTMVLEDQILNLKLRLSNYEEIDEMTQKEGELNDPRNRNR